MNINFLGYSGALQNVASANTSFLIRGYNSSILVDVSGSPFRELKIIGFDPNELDAIMLTHCHVDHIYALPSILHCLWLNGRTKELIINGNKQVISKAKDLCKVFNLDKKDLNFSVIWNTFEENQIISIKDIQCSTFKVFHRPYISTNGFIFEQKGKKVSYFPDSYVQYPYPVAVESSNLIIHEVGGLIKDDELLKSKGHSSALKVAQLALDAKADNLILVHITDNDILNNQIINEVKQKFKEVKLANFTEINI